jgi:type II secretory ATPase GspE/PulE/Tfp pilus assembly ATPase PilB-like protein
VKLPFLSRREPAAADHPTTRLVDRLIAEALAARATDLHVEPLPEGGGRLRLRIDGAFRTAGRLDERQQPRVVARLKVLAGLPVFRTGEPADGRLRVDTPEGPCDLRLSTLPVVGGEKAVVRVLGVVDRPLRLADLGLPDPTRRAVASLLDLPPGLACVVGPCSAGKTTTLHALARELLAREAEWTNVASVEDPVEQVVAGMAQCEVDPARGLDFPRALRALLRQDPDVLLVGETRDPETARLAVEAAFTGHRVLTSLHVGAPEEVPRRLDLLGVPSYLVVEALRGAVSQRLVRRPCPTCEGAGCDECGGSGHRGRRAIAEVVRFEQGRPVRLTDPLHRAALAEAAAGRTSEAEVARVLRLEGRAS